jgi:hypothetical protein
MNSKELLNTAIVDLDKVIDYTYSECTDRRIFCDLLNVVTKLKTLQSIYETAGINIPFEIPEVL